jgi:hypothetical protein
MRIFLYQGYDILFYCEAHCMTSARKILLARARKYRHSRTPKMAVVALDIFFVVCRKVSIPTWKEPFF